MRQQDHPLFWTWIGMRRRCDDERHPAFKGYGSKGIRVCDAWRNSFHAFLADVGEKPSPEYTLDRYPDPAGNYEPGNVRWATRKQQAENLVKPHPKPPVPKGRPKTDEEGYGLVLSKMSKAELARGLGIKKQNLSRWKKVPPHHVPKVAELTGLPREKILPSIYGV